MPEIIIQVSHTLSFLLGFGLSALGLYRVWQTRNDSPDWQVVPWCQTIAGLVIVSISACSY